MKFFILQVVLFICFFNVNAFAQEVFSKDCKKFSNQYKVLKVFDGDTVLLETLPAKGEARSEGRHATSLRVHKIRFLGIDAFEKEQFPYGPKGQEFLSMLILGKNVCIETDTTERDKYGRTLGYVFLNEKKSQKFINEEIVESGYAILYPSELNVRYKNRLKRALMYARSNMLGVWSKNDYILESPSEWRKKHPHKKYYKKRKTKIFS